MFQARQGDVLIERIDAMPRDAMPVPGPTILAHGEATGHAHEIKSRYARLYEAAGQRFLRVTRKATLRHQEHGEITLEPGDYQINRQREYSPESIRNVAD